MPGSCFTWSQRGGFLFNSTSQSLRGYLPAGAEEMITKGEVATVYSMTLGKGSCYFFNYADPQGIDHLAYSGLPKNVTEWLEKKDDSGKYARDFASVRITMGPYNEAIFARDSGTAFWSNLPKDLEECLERLRLSTGGWTDNPKIISLGVGGDYVLVTERGARNWRLNYNKELDKLFDLITERKMGASWITNVYLNPYRIDNWIIETEKGDLIGCGMYDLCQNSFNKMGSIVTADAIKAIKEGKPGYSNSNAAEIDALWAAMDKISIKKY